MMTDNDAIIKSQAMEELYNTLAKEITKASANNEPVFFDATYTQQIFDTAVSNVQFEHGEHAADCFGGLEDDMDIQFNEFLGHLDMAFGYSPSWNFYYVVPTSYKEEIL